MKNRTNANMLPYGSDVNKKHLRWRRFASTVAIVCGVRKQETFLKIESAVTLIPQGWKFAGILWTAL